MKKHRKFLKPWIVDMLADMVTVLAVIGVAALIIMTMYKIAEIKSHNTAEKIQCTRNSQQNN